MNHTTVRKASCKDIAGILALLEELGRPKPADSHEINAFKKIVKGYIVDKDKHVLIILVNDRIVGMVSVIVLPRLNQPTPELYIPDMVVSQKYRRHGLGKNLMMHCIRFAAKRRCHRIRLESGNARLAAHQFYQNMGFEPSALSFSLSLLKTQ